MRKTIMQNAAYWISISHLKGWKIEQINNLIEMVYQEHNSDLQDFFSLKPEDWKQLYGLDEKQIEALQESKAEIPNNAFLAENLYHQGFELIPIISPDYSPTLWQNLGLKHSPPLLYIKGNKELLKEDSIAIVGSRDASTNGLNFTHNIAKQATEDYKVVVSGFAKGIDKAALDNALNYIGHSIIVLPQGVLTFGSGYKTYYAQILEGDVLILSTFHPKSPWRVELAMARNPIIYALAKDIYVAESSDSGGTWAGVKDGLRKGRKIYIRYPKEGENNANKLLIQQGGIAVDINGKVINTQTLQEAMAKETSKLQEKIENLLSDNSLSAKEIFEQLQAKHSLKHLKEILENMEQLEKVKSGHVTKYRIKAQVTLDF